MSISGVGNNNGSGGDEINRKKRTREESRSAVVEKLLRKYKVNKLTVEFDPLTGKGVGKVGSAFNNMIAQLVRDTFSPRITRWKDVPKTDIEVIYARLDLKFIYPHDDKIFMDEVEQLLMKGLREWRHAMKKHWKELVGEHNREAPKRSPYKNIDPEDWRFLCDFFCSEEQKQISAQNLHNRMQKPLEGGHGSKSIVAHVYDNADLDTRKLPSVIDTFEQLHRKGPNGWRNEYAAEKYDAMIHMRDSQTAATSESVASAESGEDVALQHLDIITQVLGSRSRYNKGYGSMPRLKAVGGNRVTSSKSASQSREKDEAIAALNEQVATQATQLATQAEQMAQLYAQMQQLVPTFQYQQPTVPSSQTPRSSQDTSDTT